MITIAGIDLSAAFDVVDVKLLIKRLTILGLPSDVINLTNNWQRERFFYISFGSFLIVRLLNIKTHTPFEQHF